MNQSISNGVQFAWDSTSIKLWQTCPRKYYYKMREGWQSKRSSHHLWFGGLYASALEGYHKLRAKGDDHNLALREVLRDILIRSWIHPRDDEGNRLPGGEPYNTMDSAKTRDTLIRSIVWYLDHYEEDSMTTLVAEGKAAVELSFTLPVDDGIVFSGHIDRLVEYNDAVYVQDQKTTGTTLSPNFFRQFNPDTQMSLYTFAGKIIYNTPVRGVVIDAAQIAVGFTRFERGMTMRTEDQLNEWYDDTMKVLTQATTMQREGFYPRNESSCGNYGGCEFRDICGHPRSVREQFLKADFTQGDAWDPLKRR